MIDAVRASEIAAEYYYDVYRFCLSVLADPAAAEDTVQEVFLHFQQRCESLEDVNIRSYLIHVAQNKVYEKYRELKKQRELVPYDETENELAEAEALADFENFGRISDAEIESGKQRILAKLTSRDRELFAMIYEEKLTYAQIAARCGISEKAVNVRSFRMRVKIRKMAAEEFVM